MEILSRSNNFPKHVISNAPSKVGGNHTYTYNDELLLSLIEKIQPLKTSDWMYLAEQYKLQTSETTLHKPKDIKKHFSLLFHKDGSKIKKLEKRMIIQKAHDLKDRLDHLMASQELLMQNQPGIYQDEDPSSSTHSEPQEAGPFKKRKINNLIPSNFLFPMFNNAGLQSLTNLPSTNFSLPLAQTNQAANKGPLFPEAVSDITEEDEDDDDEFEEEKITTTTNSMYPNAFRHKPAFGAQYPMTSELPYYPLPAQHLQKSKPDKTYLDRADSEDTIDRDHADDERHHDDEDEDEEESHEDALNKTSNPPRDDRNQLVVSLVQELSHLTDKINNEFVPMYNQMQANLMRQQLEIMELTRRYDYLKNILVDSSLISKDNLNALLSSPSFLAMNGNK